MNGCGSKVFGVLRRFIPAAEAFGAHNNRGKYFRSQLFSALNGLAAGAPPLVFKGGAFLFRPSLRKIPTVFSKHQGHRLCCSKMLSCRPTQEIGHQNEKARGPQSAL